MPRTDRRPRQRLDPEQRRAAILDAARDAFARAPYEQVGIAAIAAACDASEALVHRYFASKGELYSEVVRTAIEALLQRQQAADATLGPDATPRQRLARSIEVYLDFIANSPVGWSAPLRNPQAGTPGAAALREQSRTHYVTLLQAVLGLEPEQPGDFALYGYLGFLDAACLAWVDAGGDESHRPALIEMALAALDSALAATGRQLALNSGRHSGGGRGNRP